MEGFNLPRTIEIETMQEPDSLAKSIANKFTVWENARDKWYRNARETLENLYATSTNEIYNQVREHDCSTHIPKLTQIRDMLVTYYLDAMFSLPDYIEWIPYNEQSVGVDRQNTLKAIVRQMLRDSKFNKTAQQLVEDYVDFGNAFVTAVPVIEQLKSSANTTTLYDGPKAIRIDPMDIFFDPHAVSFEKSPKIVRTIKTLGELAKETEELPNEAEAYKKAFKEALDRRRYMHDTLSTINNSDMIKDDICNIAGCGSWREYYDSDVVELLTFYGDIYDLENNKLYKDSRIVIMDRSKVLVNENIKDYGFGCNIFKAGWRDRKDNLWSMSPLDNIKGLQFMIDFLENKRADVFNYISNPMFVTKGDVEMPEELYPGCTINVDNDGEFTSIRPDSTALQADLYIDRYLTIMEEMAGTPREAMGFRTPGEKTAFEISQLNTASSRLFNEKVRKFEEEILEPLITLMLRIFLEDPNKVVRVHETNKYGDDTFNDFTVSTLSSEGYFEAIGSRTYTEKAKMAQTIMQIYNSAIANDQLVFNYFDPKIIANAIAYTTGLDKFKGIIKENARTDAEVAARKNAEFGRQQLEETQARGLQNAEQGIM